MTDPAATAEPHDAGEGRRWVVILRELPSEVSGEVRLRHFLKRALRDWGLRCESVQRLTVAEELEWNRGERAFACKARLTGFAKDWPEHRNRGSERRLHDPH